MGKEMRIVLSSLVWASLGQDQFLGGSSRRLTPPTWTPSNWGFGSDCATFGGDCEQVTGCTLCSFSWPVDSTLLWADPAAACRCASTGAPTLPVPVPVPVPVPTPPWTPSEFAFGDECTSVSEACNQVTGCTLCSFSWPVDSTLLWADPAAACRCASTGAPTPPVPLPVPVPAPTPPWIPSDFEYGGECNAWSQECNQVTGCTECKFAWPVCLNCCTHANTSSSAGADTTVGSNKLALWF